MRATRAIIRLDNLRHNIQIVKELVSRTGKEIKISMAVKADAYGHGAIKIAHVALEEGVYSLGVATVDEGMELREAGIKAPILLLGFPLPEEIAQIVSADMTPYVADLELTRLFEKEALKQGKRLPVHLKIDTGMGRIGCQPSSVPQIAAAIAVSHNLAIEGLATHFPLSDTTDPAFTLAQAEMIKSILSDLAKANLRPPIVSAANSGAIIAMPETYFNMVRPGIMLYGYYPSKEQGRSLALKPVMELVTRINFLKKVKKGTPLSYGHTWTADQDTWIATLPAGYGDGYSRLLSNRGYVNIGGKRYPVRGRVCMDQTLVDIGPVCTANLYDDVMLFGNCENGPDAEEIALLMNTIPYEVTCLITRRVPRVYVE
ncbi:MAG: alanine racemase [Spirochaetaceae bacterium]|nr:MAG: alanine racemase [Spirochaetaceae bacterium]